MNRLISTDRRIWDTYRTPTGEFERPFDSSVWAVPDEVRYSRRYLYWTDSTTATKGGRGMFEQFLALGEDPIPETIAKFSKKWGTLGIVRKSEKIKAEGNRRSWERCFIEKREALCLWRYWIANFAAAMRVGNCLREYRPPEPADWKRVTATLVGQAAACYIPSPEVVASLKSDDERTPWPEELDREPGVSWAENVRFGLSETFAWADAMMIFESILEEWIKIADLGFMVRHYYSQRGNSGLHFKLRTQTLFAGLVLQLVAAICGSGGYTACSICGKIYQPTRTPRKGQGHYCRGCRKAARAAAVRRHREQRRESKEVTTW